MPGSASPDLRLDRPVGYVEEVLDEFQHRGLVFRDERLALALALPATPGR